MSITLKGVNSNSKISDTWHKLSKISVQSLKLKFSVGAEDMNLLLVIVDNGLLFLYLKNFFKKDLKNF